jgi:hypothetical protein
MAVNAICFLQYQVYGQRMRTIIYCDKMDVIDVSFHKRAVINILLKETSSAADNLDRFTQTY